MAENLNTENTTEEQGQATETETKTYTEEEVQALLQKEGDRRISQYMKTQEKKNREAEKLRNMSDADRAIYELDKREAEIEEREHKLALLEMTNTASKILVDKGLSLDLVDFVVNADGEITNNNIKKLEKAFKASVKAEVEKRLGADVPKRNLMDSNEMTKEKWSKLNLVERQKIAHENPDIFKAMTN